MPLVELLQWVGANTKTGVLDLERNRVSKRIAFRHGRIVGCASNDPSALLGHVLMSRGKIKERSLQFALKQQAASGQMLSDVFVEMGLVTAEEIHAALSDSAAETVYGLFEWQNAVFRFDIEATLDRFIEADLSVDHILMNGAHRQDEVNRFRDAFKTSGVVLESTKKPLPANPEDAELVYPILELVNGERTIAEIFSKAHATEFQVLRMLHTFLEHGNVKIIETREVKGDKTTLLDDHGDSAEPVELPTLAELEEEVGEIASSVPDRPAASPKAEAAPSVDTLGDLGEVEDVTESEDEKFTEPAELEILLDFAKDKLERGDHEGALNMLDTCYRARPDDETVKKLMDKAETAYLEKVKQYLLGPEMIPVQDFSPDEAPPSDLSPAESSLLGLIDAATSVQSIVWIAPLREVEVMRALQQLHERGLIRIEKPVAAA